VSIHDDQTLTEWLAHHAAMTPDAVALNGEAGPMSFAELQAQVGKAASGLAKLGIRRGDVVGVQLPNIPAFVVSFLAVAARGGVFQTLHMPYRRKELRGLLVDSGAKAVIVTHSPTESRAEDVLGVRADLPDLQNIIALGDPLEGCLSFTEVISTVEKDEDIVRSSPSDPYLLLYTSGTTAGPKGVPHVYSRFLNNAFAAAREMQIGADATVMSLAPMSHLYGLFTLHMALAAGAAQHLVAAFHPDRVLEDIRDAKPSHIYAAPAHFAAAVAKDALDESLLKSTRVVCLSGSAVPPALAKAVDDKMSNGSVVQLWGMSELQAGCYGRPDDPVQTRMATCGRASPRTELRVLSEGGHPLPAGEEGALQVRGPSVFDGYLNRPAETSASFSEDGWFLTGDLAVIDVQGFVRITGRTKELINRGGVKYNPIEIEDVVFTLRPVTNCAVVPIPDPILGERACLCVTLAPDATLTLDEVTQKLHHSGIAKYKWPERIEVFNELPMTPTRKVIRSKLTAEITHRKEN